MVITDSFVFVHQPKTGGHFVRAALNEACRLEDADFLSRLMRRVRLAGGRFVMEVDPFHGTCHAIPEKQRGKPILSAVRSPFEYYVSQYHYGWWITHPEDCFSDMTAVRAGFPNFPDLRFEEFLMCLNRFDKHFERLNPHGRTRNEELGLCSAQFISFYFKEPNDSYASLDLDGPIDSWPSKMFDVRFLRTESLNDDLYDFLISVGYRRRNVSFIKDKSRVIPSAQNTTQRSGDYMSYYSDFAREFVLNKDLLLFKLFPEFLINSK